MADQQHETVIHRIEAWRVANAAAQSTPDNKALVKARDGLLAELKQEIIDACEPPTSRGRLSFATALNNVVLTNRTTEDVLAAVRHEIGIGPFRDNDDWDPPGGWPERDWLIPGWLPVGRLGMLSGRGGRGKSRLVLQIAARIANSPPLAGHVLRGHEVEEGRRHPLALDVQHCGPVLVGSWEDEREEVGRRLAAMAEDGLVDIAGLKDQLRFLDLRGEGAVWGPGIDKHVSSVAGLTAIGRRVRATAEDLGARLLVLDSLAGAYASDENIRSLVRGFCSDWDAWGTEHGCAVLLIAHPPKRPARSQGSTIDQDTDDDFAGSTDWHNAVRWRWSLGNAQTGYHGVHKTGKRRSIAALALACREVELRGEARPDAVPRPGQRRERSGGRRSRHWTRRSATSARGATGPSRTESSDATKSDATNATDAPEEDFSPDDIPWD